MTRALSLAATLAGAGLGAAAYLSAGLTWPAGALFVLFLLWAVGVSRRWDWVHTPALYLVFGGAAAGLFLDLNPVLLFAGAFLSLAGWDLANFSARLRLAGPGADAAGLQSRHFLRLGLALGFGAAAVLAALGLHLRLSFGWAAALSLLAALGLGRLVRSLLKRE